MYYVYTMACEASMREIVVIYQFCRLHQIKDDDGAIL